MIIAQPVILVTLGNYDVHSTFRVNQVFQVEERTQPSCSTASSSSCSFLKPSGLVLLQTTIITMLQWMGGSRRKVTTVSVSVTVTLSNIAITFMMLWTIIMTF